MLTNADDCGIISSFPREHGNPNKGEPKRNLANCINCWCGSMAEQLICNQQVVGSTPITSSNTVCRLRTVQLGGIPEWPKGTDCKSAGTAFGGSNPPSPIRNAAMAQLVERVLGKDEVPGPNPGSSLKYLRIVLLHDTQFSFSAKTYGRPWYRTIVCFFCGNTSIRRCFRFFCVPDCGSSPIWARIVRQT